MVGSQACDEWLTSGWVSAAVNVKLHVGLVKLVLPRQAHQVPQEIEMVIGIPAVTGLGSTENGELPLKRML